MSLRTILIVLLALAFGGSAAVGINSVMKKQTAEAGAVDTVPILVAGLDLARGQIITADNVTTRPWPKELVPPGAITRLEDALDRVAVNPLVKDEPVLEIKLATKGAGRGLVALIPKGMRAFTIQTPTLASGVAGFVLPGNRVDVLLTVSNVFQNDQTGGTTTTLLQNVEILAVDQRVEAPADNKVDPKELRSVTLLVTPDQAAKLDLGQNKGTLHLSLRNADDHLSANPKPAVLADLRYEQGKPWDERLKGVLEAAGKVLAQRQKELPAVKQPVVVAEPPPPTRIRTLRGLVEGEVNVTFVQPEAVVASKGN